MRMRQRSGEVTRNDGRTDRPCLARGAAGRTRRAAAGHGRAGRPVRGLAVGDVAAGRLLAGPWRGRRAFRHRRRARRRRRAGQGRGRTGGERGGDGRGGAAGPGHARRRAAAQVRASGSVDPADLRPVRRRHPARPDGRGPGRDRAAPPRRRRSGLRRAVPGTHRAGRPGRQQATGRVRGHRRSGQGVGVPRLVRADRRRQVPAPGLAVGGPQPAARGTAPHLGAVGRRAGRAVPLAWPVPGARPRPGEPAAGHRVHRRRPRRRGPAPRRARQRGNTRHGQCGRGTATAGRPPGRDGRLRHRRPGQGHGPRIRGSPGIAVTVAVRGTTR